MSMLQSNLSSCSVQFLSSAPVFLFEQIFFLIPSMSLILMRFMHTGILHTAMLFCKWNAPGRRQNASDWCGGRCNQEKKNATGRSLKMYISCRLRAKFVLRVRENLIQERCNVWDTSPKAWQIFGNLLAKWMRAWTYMIVRWAVPQVVRQQLHLRKAVMMPPC